MKSISQLFCSIYKRLNRIVDIVIALFILPFSLPFCIRKDKVSEFLGMLLFFPNGFVWFSIYLYIVHIALLAFGFTDEDARMLAPLSANPSEHFGTFFFTIFFPLMVFYIYITQTERWDGTILREHFAERIPTQEELEQAEREEKERKEKRKRMFRFFKKWFSWAFVILLGFFLLANLGAEEATPWGEIFWLSLLSATLLAVVLTMLSEDRYMKKHSSSVSEKK